MAKYNGPKDRLSRREGFDLFGKGSKLTRINVTPGVHGPKGTRGKPSQFGKQLREKQKVRRMYGILERQFRKYIDQAFKVKGNTSDALFSLLESRLDNVVYRLGFAASRAQARQMVSHRHVLVNGAVLNIPSYIVKVGDTIALKPKTVNIPKVDALIKNDKVELPSWLARKSGAGKIERKPTREDILEPIEHQDIIEYYSR